MKCENVVTNSFLEIGVGKSLEVFEDELAFVFEQAAFDSNRRSSSVPKIRSSVDGMTLRT